MTKSHESSITHLKNKILKAALSAQPLTLIYVTKVLAIEKPHMYNYKCKKSSLLYCDTIHVVARFKYTCRGLVALTYQVARIKRMFCY